MLSSSFVRVAQVSDIATGKMKRVNIGENRYLIAHVDGHFYAVDDLCSHEDMSLYLGCLEGDLIKCSLHGSRFSLKTGQPQEPPADEPIGTYRTAIKDNQVWIDPSPMID